MQYGLSPQAFCLAFPFHILFDMQLKILQVGRVFDRIYPALVGQRLEDCFQLCRPLIPLTPESLRANQHSLFLLESQRPTMRMKGQMLYLEEASIFAFLCSPWLTDINEIAPLGLSLNDFAIHDPISDYLLLLQSKTTALNDTKKLAQKLSAKQENLKKANLELEREISERIRVEVELEQARDQALEASRLKSEFLATMSHEIRTPMNGVIGMTELLLESPLPDESRRYAEVVLKEAEHLLTIINDILDFSKIEAGKLVLEQEDFAPLHIVESVAELLAVQAKHKRLSLMTYVSPDVPAIVHGDGGRLRQVLLNLVGNAIKFTEQGEVIVRLESFGVQEDRLTLRGSVSDTGIGISEQAQRLLFKPFVQADSGITRKHGGTGLGLAIASRLVHLMNGTIGVHSKVRGDAANGSADKTISGSTFWFTVEFGSVANQTSSPQMLSSVNLQGLRALVVDDNATHRTIVQTSLANWGIDCDGASRGTEAIMMLMRAASLNRPYDLAIIDQMMPGMDGIAIGQTIRMEPTLAETQLIMLTAFHEAGQEESARQAGYAAYVTKPVRQSRLFKILSHVIETKQLTQEVRQKVDVPEKETVALPRTNISVPSKQSIQQTLSSPTLPSSLPAAEILLVEDQEANQMVALQQLRQLGYRAELVQNGQEALDRLLHGTDRYRLVLMDCQMPLLDGFEATRLIRQYEQKHGGHLPIIAMTAQAIQGDRDRCIAAGMDDYISKPVRLERLKQVLSCWL